MATKIKHVVTGDQYREIDRKIRDIKRQLDQKGGSPLDPACVAKELQRIDEGTNAVDLFQAIVIMGSNKVITYGQMLIAWKLRGINIEPGTRYYAETLLQCARENNQGIADWRFVFCAGFSLREQREIRGTNPKKQPCFSGYDSSWWLKSEEDSWATRSPLAGYYLINFRDQFGGMNWIQQEQEIAKLGKEYERCHEAVFSEAILTIYLTNNGERIAGDWIHWGVSLVDIRSSDARYFVTVGNSIAYPRAGLDVRVAQDYTIDSSLRVAVVRKFDF